MPEIIGERRKDYERRKWWVDIIDALFLIVPGIKGGAEDFLFGFLFVPAVRVYELLKSEWG